MTVRAITGLVVYNLFLLGVGAGVLWGVRGWRSWTELVRLAGVAYLLGLASLMTLLTLELVLGIPIRAATIVLSGLALVLLGLVAGRLRGHAVPGLRPPAWRVPGLTLFGALFVAGIVVYLEALFRADRLSGIATTREWDSWAFWMPKAKSLYFFGDLEPDFLTSLPQLGSYPPGLATIQAGAFHAMGSADTTSLHVQYWFFAVAFVAAVAGLLAGRVRQAILYPVLLAFLVSQSLVERITTAYADVPLGYLVAVAALLVALWIEEEKRWQLAAATLLLSGAMLTKREGLLFAACVLFAAFVATWAERRDRWRPLLIAVLAVVALTLPWRIWFTAHGIEGDGPETGYLGAFEHLDRVWPSFELASRTIFDGDLWRIVPFVAIAAIVLAGVAGAWRVAIYSGAFLLAALAGATWATWAYTALPIVQDESQNPIIRITGTTVLTLAALTPLLLQKAWTGLSSATAVPAPAATPLRDAFVWTSPWLWAIVGIGVLSHPGAMVVGYSGSGLPGGAPMFISSRDCVAAPVPDRNARLVIGYATSYPEARALQARASTAGIRSVSVEKDGCGRLRVYAGGMSTAEAARELIEAREAELEPTLELDPDG
jgi:hypothetical protein